MSEGGGRTWRSIVLRICAWGVLATGAFAGITLFVTPWPGIVLIRLAFDAGAAVASAKLEKHLPTGIVVRNDIRYDRADPDALLDLYRPAKLDPEAPTVVWVHGGGFVSGDRGYVADYLKILAGRGFVVANVDYSVAPGSIYPTPVRQVGRALAFLDRNGDRLGLNRSAFVIAGDSAGAQIAAQTANLVTSPAYARLVGIAAPIAPEKLKGVLLYCGVYDITRSEHARGALAWFARTVTWAYSGHRDGRNAPGFEHMSVAHHLTARFPPTFISAGDADPLKPQSVLMAGALRRAGIPVEAVFHPPLRRTGLRHEYQFNLDSPDGRATLDRSVAWLDRRKGDR
ncbi:MAG: alpha/beta hydrolase [Sphingomonadales bacterium]|nr:MAG: alpha/beta hydrolase [Sphingomonadales bacterium]